MLSRLIKQRSALLVRSFSTSVAATHKPAGERSIREHQDIVGADILFNENKHSYVLTFPWNFQEVISQYESSYRPMSTSAFCTNSWSTRELLLTLTTCLETSISLVQSQIRMVSTEFASPSSPT